MEQIIIWQHHHGQKQLEAQTGTSPTKHNSTRAHRT